MPIYEFSCTRCEREFEKLILSAKEKEEIRCPHCGSEKVQQQLSVCASSSEGKIRSSTGSCAGCTATSCAGCTVRKP
ncbi:zinc ribbon domain-containing protein [Candidatus Bathyarchaeota archaeon]|nr:MAG: zinc ribbon domain-containing protein [Candidatus Bathyarchaeota archaeon]